MKKQIEDKPKILFKNRIVPIKGDITIASGQQVIVSLLKMITSKQPIFLPIHSDGGDFKTAKKIKQAIDNIQERGIQVIGIAIQSVRSSACYILESCKERVIEADAVLIPRILHTHCEYGFELTPQTTLAEIHESLDELVKIEREKMRNDQRSVYDSYTKRVGSALNSIETRRLYLSGKPISSAKALEVGLADKVIPKFDFNNPRAIL